MRPLNAQIAGKDIPAKRPRPRIVGYFTTDELSKRINEAIREHGTTSAVELTEAAMRDKQLEDKGVRALFVRRFLVRLDHLVTRGRVESGNGVRWKLKG